MTGQADVFRAQAKRAVDRFKVQRPKRAVDPLPGFAHLERIDFAHEIRGEQGARREVNLLGRAAMFDPALVHHDDPVGAGHRLFLIVGNVDKGGANLALDRLELILHLAAQFEVERTKRFIKQQKIGRNSQRPGKGDPLALPARKLMRTAFALIGQTDHTEHFPRLGIAFAPGHAAHPQAKGDIVEQRHMGKQRIILEHRGRRAGARHDAGHVLATDFDSACGRA